MTPNPTPHPVTELDDTARAILSAASKRFLHYGYGKTTMSEIARDCNMSTGNLYRYFPSKMDIAEAFVRSIRAEQLRRLQEAIGGAERPAAERLRAFLHTKLTLGYDRFHDRPKAYELSLEILKERPLFAGEWEAAESRIIARILDDGEKAGSFPWCDKNQTARIIQDAAFRFTGAGVAFLEGDVDELKRELDGVIDLLLDGFRLRARVAREGVTGKAGLL